MGEGLLEEKLSCLLGKVRGWRIARLIGKMRYLKGQVSHLEARNTYNAR